MRLIDADAIPYEQSENGVLDDYAYRYDINELPTIEAYPVKPGRWEFVEQRFYMGGFINMFRCSKCRVPTNREHNYCPNCGAKMDLPEPHSEVDDV